MRPLLRDKFSGWTAALRFDFLLDRTFDAFGDSDSFLRQKKFFAASFFEKMEADFLKKSENDFQLSKIPLKSSLVRHLPLRFSMSVRPVEGFSWAMQNDECVKSCDLVTELKNALVYNNTTIYCVHSSFGTQNVVVCPSR